MTQHLIYGTGVNNTLVIWSGTNTLINLANSAGVLANDGAGSFSWSSAGTGTVTGTGTTGRITQWNNGATGVLEDSTLVKSGAGVLTLSAGSAYTLTIAATGTAALGAGTGTVSSTNDVTGATHTHAITSSSNPGAAASLLATDSSGNLTLAGILTSSNTTESSGSGTGSVILAGGLGIAKNVNIAGFVSIGSSGAGSDAALLINQELVGSGTVAGISLNAQHNGTVTNLYGILAGLDIFAGSYTVSNAASIKIQTPFIGAGVTVTNHYGIYLEDVSGGSSNYSIYTNAGLVKIGDTTDSTTTTTGSLQTAGGLGVIKAITAGGIIKTGDTTDSTSTTTGALQSAGGLGVAKNIISGGNVGVTATFNTTTTPTLFLGDSTMLNQTGTVGTAATNLGTNAWFDGAAALWKRMQARAAASALQATAASFDFYFQTDATAIANSTITFAKVAGISSTGITTTGGVTVSGANTGAASSTSFTNVTNTTVTNTYLVKGGQAANTINTGWIKIFIGTNAAWIPYWQNATP